MCAAQIYWTFAGSGSSCPEAGALLILAGSPQQESLWPSLPGPLLGSATTVLLSTLETRLPKLTASTWRFSELGLLEDKKSFQLARVPLASCERGNCSVAPSGSSKHWISTWLDPSIESVQESPMKESSISSWLISGILILIPRVKRKLKSTKQTTLAW